MYDFSCIEHRKAVTLQLIIFYLFLINIERYGQYVISFGKLHARQSR